MSGYATWADWVDSGEWADGSDSAMPMLPALAADVMSLALDSDVSITRLARVITKDQVLATRVLRPGPQTRARPTPSTDTACPPGSVRVCIRHFAFGILNYQRSGVGYT